jgi:hypothetical protein
MPDYCAIVSGIVALLLGFYIGRGHAEGRAKPIRIGLQATIRTLENQVSRMADKLSRYEGGAGLPLCGHCGMQGGKHHVACPTRLGNVTPLSGSGSEPQA